MIKEIKEKGEFMTMKQALLFILFFLCFGTVKLYLEETENEDLFWLVFPIFFIIATLPVYKGKKIFKLVLFLAFFSLIVILFWNINTREKYFNLPQNKVEVLEEKESEKTKKVIEEKEDLDDKIKSPCPMDRAEDRISKKPFGILITKENSPIRLERFSGFHTGTDFEIFEDEKERDVEVSSVCEGKIVLKRLAQGYGGVLVQSCKIENETISIVYGHLKILSIAKNIGEKLEVGEKIGFLGDEYSVETDGERKHLHFGIYKGKEINTFGYVKNEKELLAWINPMDYFCK